MPKANSMPILSKAANQYTPGRFGAGTKPTLLERLRQVLLTASNEENRPWSYQVLIMTKQPKGKNHINTWI